MGEKEAIIFINGKELSLGQSMTIRGAIENFYGDLSQNGLGDDEIGIKITEGYKDKIQEIREFIFLNL